LTYSNLYSIIRYRGKLLFNQDGDYLCPLKDWFARNAVEAKNILSIQQPATENIQIKHSK
ncbi:MAG: hypothetical protein ACKOFS_02960, partial [Microcystis panniformis]